ncbi:MAG TPA: TonB-dependent receptor, partial [Burkholderiales bacterium]|nr:TonB-dependent receptor [Burkholderiales bacterium]
DSVPPTDVLERRSLLLKRKSSLGETLDGVPGVTSTYFGPSASRPVIRGLDGDRIRILQNGTNTNDASSLSFDHAVPYDPLVAERIEVVRGPAAVLYGGNAVGGVVNLIDNRIPQSPLSGVSGRVEPRLGGADGERSLGGVLEAGNGTFALHADFFDRGSRDLRIPGFARSARQRALDGPGFIQPEGRLDNSNATSDGGTLGGSLTFERGYVGISHGAFRSNYGSIPEPTVRIDIDSERTDFAGELRDLGSIITTAKFKAGRTDYEHRELDTGVVGTTFKNKGGDGRLELTHAKFGPLQGAFGLSLSDFDFSALGDEAFVPVTSTRSRGAFLFEELPAGDWKFSFGLRNERSDVQSAGGARFGDAQSRSFNANS